jgi:hypothetical protein
MNNKEKKANHRKAKFRLRGILFARRAFISIENTIALKTNTP